MSEKRAIILARVSGDKQEDNTSLDSQEAACRAYVAAQGWAVGLVLREVWSGADDLDERPVMREVRAAIRSGQYAAFVCWRMSRATRAGAIPALMLGHECERAGVEWHVVEGQYKGRVDVSTLLGLIQAAILSDQAHQERKTLIETMQNGLRARAVERGQPRVGATRRYGYTWVDGLSANGRTIPKVRTVINAAEAAIVRRCYNEAATGASLRSITSGLMRDGVPSMGGGPFWNISALRGMLRDPRYKGEAETYVRAMERIAHKKYTQHMRPPEERVKLPEGTFPAIVSADLWDAVQARLDTNGAMAARNNQHPQAMLLRGYATCAICNHKLQVRRKHPNTPQETWVYYCPSGVPWTAEAHAHEARPMIAASILDAVVWAVICRVCREPDIVVHALAKLHTNDGETLRGDLAAAEQTRDALVERERSYIRMGALVSDQRQADEVQAMLALLADQRCAAEEHVAKVERRLGARERAQARVGDAQELLRRLAPHLDNATYTERRHLVYLLVERVKLWPDSTAGGATVAADGGGAARPLHPDRYHVKLTIPDPDAPISEMFVLSPSTAVHAAAQATQAAQGSDSIPHSR